MKKDTQNSDASPGTPPAPTPLSVQSSESSRERAKADDARDRKEHRSLRGRRAYRPSHKATFIGVLVVFVVLAINIAVLFFFISNQQTQEEAAAANAVTLSDDTLSSLGVNRTSTSTAADELVVGPDSRFGGSVTIADSLTVSSDMTLNGLLSGQTMTATDLQASNVSVDELSVNGDGVFSGLTVRTDLGVAGTMQVQGQATFNSNVTVSGNLAVTGSLAFNSLELNSVVIRSSSTFGGHIKTSGGAPGVSLGGAGGSNATVSISGNDIAGTVAVNVGVGASSGTLATVTFRQSYASTPRVIISPAGHAAPNVYVNRTSGGFVIMTGSSLPPGGYAFDYIVIE